VGVEGMHMELFSARLRAISPVIAMIIVVAITLAIAFAVVGWMFGLWSGLATGSPQISITNAKVYWLGDYKEKKSYAVVELYIVNEGLESDKILKIELIKDWKTIATELKEDEGWIKGNSKTWVTYSISLGERIKSNNRWIWKQPFKLFAGDNVLVRIYMMKSGTFTIPVVASPSKTIGKS